jgi:pimeloyl-ACP methyl ester carboxylesterase
MESQSAPLTDAEALRSASIDAGGHRLFARLHLPARTSSSAAVLICPPWGPDEPASYRARRAWGLRLAEAGHPTLRFDLPGTGDSTGGPGDEKLVSAWVGSVGAAATWLREEQGADRVVALGLGLGGLLALAAIDQGAPIAALATWAAPNNGRAFVREMRNFSRLEDWNAAGEGGNLPAGWFEVDGFVLSDSTIAELEALKVDGNSRVPAKALLIGRSTGQPPKGLGERLEGLGCEVTLDPGGRWGSFVSHPESSRLPAEVADSVEQWLAESVDAQAGSDAVRPAPAGSADPTAEIRLEAAGGPIRETTLTVSLDFGEVFGVLAEPPGKPAGDLCAVLLNSGAQRHSGPSRMWTERARAWAARGVPTLRIDLQEIGEAGGDPDGMPPGDEYFSPKFAPQVTAVLDALAARDLGPRFLLLGLCSGAYHAFRAAVADERVAAAILVNPTVLVWRPGIFEERELRLNVHYLGEGERLRKFLRGEIGLRRLREWGASVAHGARQAAARLVARRGRRVPDWQAQLLVELAALAGRDVPVLVAFSGEEWLADEFEEFGFTSKLKAFPNVTLLDLPGDDHSLRPTAAQRRFAEITDAQLAALVGDAGSPAADERLGVTP